MKVQPREDAPLRGIVRVPGKLMLCGEYTVLSPGGVALALPVPTDLWVGVEVSGASDAVTSEALGLVAVAPDADPRLRYVAEAVTAARCAVGETAPLAIRIGGSMQAPGGAKLGLGSSSAVVVGVIYATWALLQGSPPPVDTLFRLSHWAHRRAQGKLGSGYDVATIAATMASGSWGAVEYRPPHEYRLATGDAASILGAPWPENAIRVHPWPRGVRILAVWSGESADTRALVRRTAPAQSLEAFGHMKASAARVVDAWMRSDAGDLVAAVGAAEAALRAWDAAAHTRLFLPQVDAIAAVIASAGAVARTSGAGGGDCLLAVAPTHECFCALRSALDHMGAMWFELPGARPSP